MLSQKLVRGKPRKVRHVKREIDQDDSTPNTSPEKKKLKKDIVAEAVLETIEKREDTVIIEAPEFVLPEFVGDAIDDDSVSNEVELHTEMADMDKENAEKYKNDYVRGLRCKNNADKKGYDYCSYKCLMEVKERTKDVFVINIPPPEFTEEDFVKFVFPKPIQELEVIPEKLATTIKPKHGSKHCEVCNEDFPNHQQLKMHFFVTHTIHYVCPVENCKHVVAKLDSHKRQFELARHIWGHDHEHPQLSMPHECIACGFTTPYVGSVQDHVENMGPVHDNRCPTPGCEARFSSYAEYQDHATQHGHLGFKCGWCDEVFETMAMRGVHRRRMHVSHKGVRPAWMPRPPRAPKESSKEVQCAECGKICRNRRAMASHIEVAHTLGEFPCEICGRVFRNITTFKEPHL